MSSLRTTFWRHFLSNATLEDLFDLAWDAVSADGGCDDPQGMEYRRLWKEWHDNFPELLESWIKARANRPPTIVQE